MTDKTDYKYPIGAHIQIIDGRKYKITSRHHRDGANFYNLRNQYGVVSPVIESWITDFLNSGFINLTDRFETPSIKEVDSIDICSTLMST